MAAFTTAVAAFNLICTGTFTSGKILEIGQPESAVKLVLRIDLDSNRWCFGDCRSTAVIKQVADTSIIFRMAKDDDGDDLFSVNRETGDFIDRTRNFAINWITMTRGNCEKAPFTGFPVRKF